MHGPAIRSQPSQGARGIGGLGAPQASDRVVPNCLGACFCQVPQRVLPGVSETHLSDLCLPEFHRELSYM